MQISAKLSISMPFYSPLEPPIVEAKDIELVKANISRMTSGATTGTANAEFVVGAITRGMTPELVELGYTYGVMPWPSLEQVRDHLYPWGRVSLCTCLFTNEVHLTQSFKKRVRDALAHHYEGQTLTIELDTHYEGLVDTIADHYHFSQYGTWLSNEMKKCWKQVHSQGLTHGISVSIGGRLAGGLLFGSKGAMLYGESAFSWRADTSKLALLALCAIGRVYSMPLVDCQVASPFVNSFRPVRLTWDDYLKAQQAAVNRPSIDWQSVPRELTEVIAKAFPSLTPRPASCTPRQPLKENGSTFEILFGSDSGDDANSETPPRENEKDQPNADKDEDEVHVEGGLSLVEFGDRELVLPVIGRRCSYFHDRHARFEIFNFPPGDNPEVNSQVYSLASIFGFRREVNFMSRPVCRDCQRCVSTRVDVQCFQLTESMRRILKRNSDLIAELRPATEVTDEYWDLYQRYMAARHANSHMNDFTRDDVNSILFSGSVISYALEIRTSKSASNPNQLLMVCIIDQLDNALSAVYNFYDPDYEKRSLGTFGILTEIHFAERMNLAYLYLGHWLKDFAGMDYKRHYRPLTVFVGQRWMDIDDYLQTDPDANTGAPSTDR